MPGSDVIDKSQESLAVQLRGLDIEELAVVQVKVIYPRHIEGPQLAVQLLHLELPQQRRQLHCPLHVHGEHGAGVEDGDQGQVGVQQHQPVGGTQPGELLEHQNITNDHDEVVRDFISTVV